jgi:excisionase family DNA binding protein
MSWRDELRAAVEAGPREGLPDLAAELARAQAVLMSRLSSPRVNSVRPPSPLLNARYLKPAEVAERLSISEKWVYRHAAELGAVKLGGSLRIPESRLVRYLKAHG